MRRLPVMLTLALAVLGMLGAAAAASAQRTGTVSIVVRPVHANGHPVAGWTVVRQSIADFRCNGGASVSAVDPNIVFCGYSATYTPSCWKSRNSTALCLRNPRSHTLYRIPYVGRFVGAAAPAHPQPQALKLRDNGYCEIRDGGAWGSPPTRPLWYGTYGCNSGGGIYTGSGDGIDTSVNPWRVHVWKGGPTILRDRVTTAYFVGTAS